MLIVSSAALRLGVVLLVAAVVAGALAVAPPSALAHDPSPASECISGYSYNSGSGMCERVNRIRPLRRCPTG